MTRSFLSHLLFFSLASCSGKTDVDLIVKGATVYTMDSAFSTAAAIAIKDGKIAATGTVADILKTIRQKIPSMLMANLFIPVL